MPILARLRAPLVLLALASVVTLGGCAADWEDALRVASRDVAVRSGRDRVYFNLYNDSDELVSVTFFSEDVLVTPTSARLRSQSEILVTVAPIGYFEGSIEIEGDNGQKITMMIGVGYD
jgi:hypothetical protein